MPVHALPFTPAVEYTSSGTPSFSSGPWTLGYQFSTSVPFNVNALGYWDTSGVGIGLNNHQVGIWDSVGTLLVTTTVLNTDPIQGHFQYHSISIYTLSPGVYRIGGEYLGNFDPVPSNVVGFVPVPGFTWTTGAASGPGAGLTYPNNTGSGGLGPNDILVVGFSIGSAVAVPESSTLILLAAGLAGILGYGWRRKRAA